LFGKNLELSIHFILFGIPLINASNHSGAKFNWRHVGLVSTISLVVLLYFNEKSQSTHFICICISLIFLLLIMLLTLVRKKNESIPENYFAQSLDEIDTLKYFPHSYKIYSSLIEGVQNLKILNSKYDQIDKVMCFDINKDKPKLINSSLLIHQYSFDLPEENIENVPEEVPYFIAGMNLIINNEELNNCIAIKPSTKFNTIFVFSPVQHSSNFIYEIFLFEAIVPVLEKLVRIIHFERIYKSTQQKNRIAIKNKLSFIRNSERAMHFIKNKLTPLDNLIEILKEQHLEKSNVLYDNPEVDKIIKSEIQKSDKNISKLVSRTNSILNKNKSPFYYARISDYSPIEVYFIVVEVAQEFIREIDNLIKFMWNIEAVRTDKVTFNRDGLYVLITDWMSNMIKHGSDYKIHFKEDDNTFILTFINKFNTDFLPTTEKMVSDFNEGGRTQIIKRKSHGLFQIRTAIDEMGLEGFMSINENDILQFDIHLKRKKHEI